MTAVLAATYTATALCSYCSAPRVMTRKKERVHERAGHTMVNEMQMRGANCSAGEFLAQSSKYGWVYLFFLKLQST
eukprot:COSAG06_NODE_27706_length_588_cov_0.625767_1_plen_75_part_10